MVTAYFNIKKSPLKTTVSIEINIIKNNIPAAALISRSFRTGILYPSTLSPNFIILFIDTSLWFIILFVKLFI